MKFKKFIKSLNNLTKLTSANILAIAGHLFMAYFFFTSWIYIPLDEVRSLKMYPDQDLLEMVYYMYLASCTYHALCIFVTFLVFILIEFIIRRINKTEFQLVNKIPKKYELGYKILFWLGIFNITPFAPILVCFAQIYAEVYTHYTDFLIKLVY